MDIVDTGLVGLEKDILDESLCSLNEEESVQY